ncbi:hypothetical protein KGF54_001026 [Candida jiufengensis]|uniref:uncharacterized protein n=1 Tax=Candida jiufengensis TaxID=497108 RepID=UPI0022245834|nr:uncharacterized protein KGF54_001026 [Candida jiufengensis]KAI5956551.1 hypothetical protein KGF54_001026 [Candida jiufengensis]
MSTPSAEIEVIDPEKQFVKTYVELMELSKNAPFDQFYSTHDYNKLSSLGPSLPKFKYNFPTTSTDQSFTDETPKIAKFKSIKPPFKFSTELKVSPNESIYKIKSNLIESIETLKSSNIKPRDLKLMVKSKVAQDSATLSTLIGDNQEISFNCVISNIPSTTTTKEPEPVIPTSNDDPEVEQPFALSSTAWSKIYEIILKDINDPAKAKALVHKFQQDI